MNPFLSNGKAPALAAQFSDSHQPGDRVPCPIGCGKTFSREQDAKRHANEVDHGKDTTKHCMMPGCLWRGAKRDGRYEKHMATSHNIIVDFPPDFIDEAISSSIGFRPEQNHSQGLVPAGIDGASSSSTEPFLQRSQFTHDEMPYNATSFIGREKHHIPGASNGLDGFSQLKQPLSWPSSPSPWASSAESGLSTNKTEQFFVKPAGMRPNTVFIGRELELAELHKMLMDKRRRAEGTSAVLLQCLPGGGKTHLAREYIYQHRDEYPGGIFFVQAKSSTELAAGFWDIARKVNLSFGESNNPQHFVSAVINWLNRRHEWLLVLDGIHFSYTQDLRHFIPDSKDTSLLYTSTERAFADHHHFMNPQIIRIPLLSAREAQILLLTELDRREPYKKDDLRYSMELVKSIGFLPVVIHAVARRLKAIEEPLSRFAKSYNSEPRLRGLTSYMAVVSQLTLLGAIEAVNLIRIISFFSHHIPVEMIRLGIPSVDVPVKTRGPITGASLNKTMRILTSFALIDRNEHEQSTEYVSDQIDVIRMHTAVQGFFVDTCKAENQISTWLHRAVALFCQSFSTALRRINRMTNAGLVEDFRMYEIHGKRLLDHLQQQAKKERKPSGWQSTLRRSLDAIKTEIDKRIGPFSKIDMYCLSIFDHTPSSNSSSLETPMKQAGSAISDSDLESIASIKDDIFSDARSFSTASRVSSTRFTAIEFVVGKFIEDKELSNLYEEAIKLMPKIIFVHKQRRLLKRLFLDLRPEAKTPIQQQATRILRGRSERSSIAEQVWTIISPSNASRHAQMPAFLPQKPDKQGQLDRLVGGEDTEVGAIEKDTLSEASEDSDSEGSSFADDDAEYPNIDVAVEFLTGGAPFKQYKLDFRGFLRMDASPAKLRELVVAGDVSAVSKILLAQFDEVAQQEFDWLHELLDIGCSFEEMARLLIDGEQASPWVLLDRRISMTSAPSLRFHQTHCVHSGGQRLDTAPRMINTNSRNASVIDHSRSQEIISELCGIAGAIPLSVDEYDCEWMSSVEFTKDNTVAWVRYAGESTLATPIVGDSVLRMLDAMRRAYFAIGYLQETGICCDKFTVFVQCAGEKIDAIPCVELCTIDITLVVSLHSTLQLWYSEITNAGKAQYLRSCGSIARKIISIVSKEYSEALEQSYPDASVAECGLAVQILSVGILSYAQGHAGSLHPDFLVEPLLELHLLGNSTEASGPHIVVSLFQLTCIGDMLQRPVLAFRAVNVGKPPSLLEYMNIHRKHDIFASPEDIADTWNPARFVADTSTIDKSSTKNLWAIEIAGGTIAHVDSNLQKLHWMRGNRSSFAATFGSKQKILIGGVTVNDKCPLDEAESWRHPATNAYLRHLGTHQGGWELQQKQVGLQGGQYVVLAFNATYVKTYGVTLKQQQLMLPSNEIDLAFLNSHCGLQVSFCTGVARRVALRELLADIMIDFVESKASKPARWDELKSTHSIVQNFRVGNLGRWFDGLEAEERESATHVVRSMLEVLKDTGIDKSDEELVIAWVRRESPYSCLRLRCEKTSLWARILADSENCATFACITPLCLEIEKHKCRELAVAPWHNVSNLLDTAVCPQFSNRELMSVVNTIEPFKLEHQVSYWIGKSGSNLIAKVWLTNDPEPRLIVRQKVIPEKYRSRLPRAMVERLGRLREQQVSSAIASQVVILAEIPH